MASWSDTEAMRDAGRIPPAPGSRFNALTALADDDAHVELYELLAEHASERPVEQDVEEAA